MHDKRLKTALSIAILAVFAISAFADYEADCKAAAKRKRNVMYYELGYNPCLWPKNKPFSAAAFRSVNCANDSLDAYAHTKVNIDSFVYVPIGGFALLSAKIPGVDTPSIQPNKNTRYLAGVRNAMPDFQFGKEKLPPEGKYQWYKAGTLRVPPQRNYIYINRSWTIQTSLDIAELHNRQFDVWVSMKFTGKEYYPDSKEEKSYVWVERMVLVPTEGK